MHSGVSDDSPAAAPIASSPAVAASGRHDAIGQAIAIGVYHAFALLAFVPYFFSWWGVGAAVTGGFLCGLVGINLGYHRLLAHRSISCSKRMERAIAFLGVLSMQWGPAYWVAIHRRHHGFSDRNVDPHSPGAGFFWAHIGWIFDSKGNGNRDLLIKRYARDLLDDEFYAWLEKSYAWAMIPYASWVVYFLAGFGTSVISGHPMTAAVRFGASLLIWGVFVRTVVVWHCTWAVNSFSHVWGYRTYDTPDNSRNNPLVGILVCGEGWHNNHHAFPRSARHGHKWWEIDATWIVIRCLAVAGLVKIRPIDLGSPRVKMSPLVKSASGRPRPAVLRRQSR
jgi:fatty-acid desaturase